VTARAVTTSVSFRKFVFFGLHFYHVQMEIMKRWVVINYKIFTISLCKRPNIKGCSGAQTIFLQTHIPPTGEDTAWLGSILNTPRLGKIIQIQYFMYPGVMCTNFVSNLGPLLLKESAMYVWCLSFPFKLTKCVGYFEFTVVFIQNKALMWRGKLWRTFHTYFQRYINIVSFANPLAYRSKESALMSRKNTRKSNRIV